MSPGNNDKKDVNKKQPDESKKNDKKKPKSSASSLASTSSTPSTILDKSSSKASSVKDPTSSTTNSRTKASQVTASSSSSIAYTNMETNVRPSRIMDKSTAHKSRSRVNPLTTSVANHNLPSEASAENITEKTVAGPLSKDCIFQQQIKEEFASNNVRLLNGTALDPERFLKPTSAPTDYLNRQVDPQKLINFLVDHMNVYYDLEKHDEDPFSKTRQQMDDILWDTLGFLIPLMCKQICDLLKDEPLIVELDAEPDLVVFGDLHGNFNDVYYIYQNFINNPQFAHHRFVFLGDYVDRGPKPIEIVSFLFAQKLAHPNRFVLLRGNHEVAKVNQKYGFKTLCEHVFSDTYIKHPIVGKFDYLSFNQAFACLPVAAVVKGPPGRRVFLCHGGIPNQHLKPKKERHSGWTIAKLNQLAHKPVALAPSKDARNELALNEILWNDPLPEKIRKKLKAKSNHKPFFRNKKRGGHCAFFSERGLRLFFEVSCCRIVISISNTNILNYLGKQIGSARPWPPVSTLQENWLQVGPFQPDADGL